MLFVSFQAQAQQSADHYCGTDPNASSFHDPVTNNRRSLPNCDFNVAYVKDNCLEVYVRTNIHFFVNDDCGGTTAATSIQEQLPASSAFQAAEDLITNANAFNLAIGENNQWHQDQWGAPETPDQCVPLRYVLNNVYIHCNTADKTVALGENLSSYLTDPTTQDAMNLFVTNINGPDNGYVRFYGDRWAVVENLSAQNLVHEFGHSFELRHTHDGQDTWFDNCEDTWWRETSFYDANEDGTYEYVGNRCWNNSPPGKDLDGDGIPEDLCDDSHPLVITEHPCCNWYYQNNNVMTHSSWAPNPDYGAFTPCQMTIALTELSTDKCDLIETINPGCPPPSAFIGVLPDEDLENDCAYCFYLQSSTNDDDYHLILEVMTPSGWQPYLDEGWLPGPSSKFCVAVATNIHNKFADAVLIEEAEYRLTLTSRNLCGDTDDYTLTFETAEDCAIDIADPGGILIGEDIEVFPNPSWETTKLTYEILEEAEVQIFVSHLGVNGNYQPPTLKSEASGNREEGQHEVDFSNYEIVQGLNYIIIVVGDVTYVRAVVKY